MTIDYKLQTAFGSPLGSPARQEESCRPMLRLGLVQMQWQADEKAHDEALREGIVNDGHAPERFRVQTVRNLDPWYGAWGAKPGEALYLDPKDRVRIW